MGRGEQKLEGSTPSGPARSERPRLGQVLAVCLMLGGAFGGCSAGGEMTAVQERASAPRWRPLDADPASAAVLGRDALDKVGYARLIARAEQAGFVTTKRIPKSARQDASMIAMSGAVPMDEVMRVFTKYAVAAGVASQADSPIPGPGRAGEEEGCRLLRVVELQRRRRKAGQAGPEALHLC